MEYNLLEKTEIWITGIRLQAANLTGVACAAAEALGLDHSEVLVVDVREDLLTLDVLRKTVLAEEIAGKQAELLDALREVPGVELTGQTRIHSDGVLGMITLEPGEAEQVLERTRRITENIRARIARRAIVFSSGFEVRDGIIEDTNSPYIRAELEKQGFRATAGRVLNDDLQDIVSAFQEAANQGFGLVITTGGVGAESKDHSVEALLSVDPEATTPWLVKYQVGQGRHVKEGVRIGVGQLGPTTIINLPGPHDEVRVALPVILHQLENGPVDKSALADAIAGELRQTLHAKMQTSVHRHHTKLRRRDEGNL